MASVLILNVALAILYLWSLGESYHVVVHVGTRQISASLDGDTLVVPRKPAALSPSSDRFGLQQGTYFSYRLQATGEAIQLDTKSWIGRLAEAVRLAQPGPAWSNLHVVTASGREVFDRVTAERPSGSWRRNWLGEWQGAPGAYALYGPVRSPTYALSADLLRPDGSQSTIVAVDEAGDGYALQVRLDQPDMLLSRWHNGRIEASVGGTGLNHINPVAAARRDIRLLLTGYLFTLLFAALALGLYLVLAVPFHDIARPPAERRPRIRFRAPGRAIVWFSFAALTASGSLATGLVATYLLARIPHVQDDVAYLFQAKILALGRFNVPAPPIAIQSFFHEEFIPFYDGRLFAQYPPGHPLVLMLGVLTGAPWLVDPVLASLGIGCVFLLGRRVYGGATGALAAALGLSSPFWLFMGSSMLSHPTGMLFGVLCMLCIAISEATEDVRWPILAGLSSGMVFITRPWTAIGLLSPFAVYALFRWRRSPRTSSWALVGLAFPVLFLLVYNWAQMGSPFTSVYAAWNPADQPGFSANAPAGLFTPGDGLWNAYQNLAMLAVHLYGWPYCVAFGLILAPFVFGAARLWDYLLLSSFLGVVCVYIFYWCPCLMYGPRFYYEALPPLLLLTARGVYELGRLPLRAWSGLGVTGRRGAATVLPAGLLLALLAYNLGFYLPAQISLYHDYNYSSDAELRAVARAHLRHALVFVVTNPVYAWWDYGNVFSANDPLLRGNVIYARDLGTLDPVLYRYFPHRTHYRLDGTQLTLMR